jgi:hypothetical protein
MIIIYGYQGAKHRTGERNTSIIRKKNSENDIRKKEQANASSVKRIELDLSSLI